MSVTDEKTARRALYARIAIARKKRGELLDDDIYRDKMAGLFKGRRSATALSVAELAAWASCLEKGQMELPRFARKAGNAQARKIHAIWADLGKKGVLRDPSRGALRGFCARVTGAASDVLIDPDMMAAADRGKVIEALKAMQARHGKELSHDAPV